MATPCGVLNVGFAYGVSPRTYDGAGQPLTYSYIVTNLGTAPLAGELSLCDSFLGPWAAGPVFLLPGASQVYTRVYTTAAADLACPSIVSTAYATVAVDECLLLASAAGAAGAANTAAGLVAVVAQAYDPASQRVTFTATLVNPTAAAAANALASFTVPPGVLNIVPGAGVSSYGTSVALGTSLLPPGGVQAFSFSYQPASPSPSTYVWNGTLSASIPVATPTLSSAITV